jgi:voltage-gated potassium channel
MTGERNESEEPQRKERLHVLAQLEEWLEWPMTLLAFVWLMLVVVDLLWPSNGIFEFLGLLIWGIFIVEFLIRLAVAPEKWAFVVRNPITVIALIAPAFRFLRVVRILRVSRGLRLVRVVGTANRSINALRSSFEKRGLSYVMLATSAVIFLGAAGMLAFEPAHLIDGGFTGYGDALWWTAMLVATMGSGFWPQTPEGRMLALLLAVYGLAVFGYITASFATYFIGREAQEGDVASSTDINAIRDEVHLMRRELRDLRRELGSRWH